MNKKQNFWYTFGYDVIGILYTGFTQWLKEQAVKDGVDKLFFLSRDGYIMKQVYDVMTSREESPLPSEYLYASRRAFNFPAITKINDDAIRFLNSYSLNLTVAQYLERVGLQADHYIKPIQEAGFSGPQHRVVKEDHERMISLYHSIEIDLLTAAADERGRLVKYMEQVSFFEAQHAAVVDIGWHGTMQQSLQTILSALGKEPANLWGYYLGTFSRAAGLAKSGLQMSGYLCHLGYPDRQQKAILECVELFEFLFTAPHGSVLGFQEKDGLMIPVFDQNDNDQQKLDAASLIQQGALKYVHDYCESTGWKPFENSIPSSQALQPIERVLSRPNQLEAEKLGDIMHAKGFGDVYINHPLAKPPELTLSLSGFMQLQLQFRRSLWKEGYKRRVPVWQRPLLKAVHTAMIIRHKKIPLR